MRLLRAIALRTMETISPLGTDVRSYGTAAIAEASRLILAGQCVAVATETVYGLAADATNGAAVAAIYAAKGRPSFNPLIVHVSDLEAAERLAHFDDAARALAAKHWPGPLTLVLPAHPAIQELLRVSGKPLAAPSANASGTISPTRAAHVLKSLAGRIPLIIDAGATQAGLESTIIALTDGAARLLRPGPIDLGLTASSGDSIEAPGQLASHYAPSKPLRLAATSAEEGEWLIGYGPMDCHANLSLVADLKEAAANLFDLLHQADASSSPKIAVAPIPVEGLGEAINDRLNRAAA